MKRLDYEWLKLNWFWFELILCIPEEGKKGDWVLKKDEGKCSYCDYKFKSYIFLMKSITSFSKILGCFFFCFVLRKEEHKKTILFGSSLLYPIWSNLCAFSLSNFRHHLLKHLRENLNSVYPFFQKFPLIFRAWFYQSKKEKKCFYKDIHSAR